MTNRKAIRRARRIRRTVLTVCLMALVAVISIGATVAYLTSNTQAITNTFTAGDVEITLTETKGTLTKDTTTGKVTASSFKMVPGAPIVKDPTINVLPNSEACYVYVKVVKSENADTYLSYEMDDVWTDMGNGVYYTTVSATEAAAGKTLTVLKDNKVTVNNVSATDMETAENEAPTLTFTAYAIQSNNLPAGTTAETAYNLITK